MHLIFERTDGSRLTLRLPSSDWDRITGLGSRTAFTPAIFISSWDRQREELPCDFAWL